MSDTSITAGSAVKHKNGCLIGRVHHVIGRRAICSWVRRHNRSWAYVENLTVIPDAELIAHFRHQEAMYDALIDDPEWHECGVTPPAKTNPANREFLLGGVS